MATSRGVVGKLIDKQKRNAMRTKLGTGHRWDEQILAAPKAPKVITLRKPEDRKPAGWFKGRTFNKWRYFER